MASWTPSLVSPVTGAERVALGHRLVDDCLEVVRVRCRGNTVRATAYHLKVFFTVVAKDPVEVTVADVLGFIRSQRGGGGKVVRLADGGSGLALSTVRRRLSTVSGLYGFSSRWGWWTSTRCCGAWQPERRPVGCDRERRWCARSADYPRC
jgi:integrase/recombinase XerD